MSAGVPPPQGYPGAQGGHPPPAGPYPGGAAPPGQYQGGPPPAGAAPPGQYQGGPPPAGAAPPGQYQGGPPPAGAHAGAAGPGAAPPGGPPAGAGDVNVQWKGDTPNEDVEDNPNAAASQPTAPPVEKMDTVAGYGNLGFEAAMLPPPSYDEAVNREPPQREAVSGLPQIREDEAREALLQHVAEHCCYGKGAAQQLQFTDLQHSSAFHYTLETFGEARATAWAFEPYARQAIDGPNNGPAPGAWDIQANPASLFQNQAQDFEVPHTASVKPCHHCCAMGRIRCHRCYGRGRVRCTTCNGMGQRSTYREGEHYYERCSWCYGSGRITCMNCHGDGMITCTLCAGNCNLKCYIKLTITWTNHLQDHIVERTALPDTLIRTVSGQIAFEEQQPRVWPINHFPDAEINSASQRLVTQHGSAFPSERLLMQRHKVRVIPVTQALFKWKTTDSDYFVYGFEKKIYAPNYPQQCCCGCNLL